MRDQKSEYAENMKVAPLEIKEIAEILAAGIIRMKKKGKLK